jgi:hypothetical protein
MSEQCGRGRIPPQGGAVHLHELPFQLVLDLLQLVNARGELTLTGTGRANQHTNCSAPLDWLSKSGARADLVILASRP